MRLTPIQLEQLKNYVDACMEVRDAKDPKGTLDHRGYWQRRADAEEHMRNMFGAFQSSLVWGA
jgi:hypothetical protein|tara:strand:- start:358 stop:546 length:189 start_codon:yes stop_codon:yes gene_type:complete